MSIETNHRMDENPREAEQSHEEGLEAIRAWAEAIEAGDIVVLNEDAKKELTGPESLLSKELTSQDIRVKEFMSWCRVIGPGKGKDTWVVAGLFGKATAEIPGSALRKVPDEEFERTQGQKSSYNDPTHRRDLESAA